MILWMSSSARENDHDILPVISTETQIWWIRPIRGFAKGMRHQIECSQAKNKFFFFGFSLGKNATSKQYMILHELIYYEFGVDVCCVQHWRACVCVCGRFEQQTLVSGEKSNVQTWTLYTHRTEGHAVRANTHIFLGCGAELVAAIIFAVWHFSFANK